MSTSNPESILIQIDRFWSESEAGRIRVRRFEEKPSTAVMHEADTDAPVVEIKWKSVFATAFETSSATSLGLSKSQLNLNSGNLFLYLVSSAGQLAQRTANQVGQGSRLVLKIHKTDL